jgi:hypothetical protein
VLGRLIHSIGGINPRRNAADRGVRAIARAFAMTVIAALLVAALAAPVIAQDDSMNGSGEPSIPPVNGSAPTDLSMPPPIPKLHIRQGITGSMLVAPPYGVAPLQVGFFVLADDPEGIGFLTYSWNFGDGTVSSLPPELYIFHTYQAPGNYVCTLVAKTIDGRQKTFIQGIIVRPPGD